MFGEAFSDFIGFCACMTHMVLMFPVVEHVVCTFQSMCLCLDGQVQSVPYRLARLFLAFTSPVWLPALGPVMRGQSMCLVPSFCAHHKTI